MLSLLWIPATLVAAAAQTARNATQRRLVDSLGTAGATQVRFLYGLPFAGLFLVLVLAATGEALPRPGQGFAGFILLGAVSQILATGLMLAAMRERSFAVVTALIKTEPVQVALFGLLVLHDRLSLPVVAAILVATAGVLLVSGTKSLGELAGADGRSVALGIVSGACFALASIGFRGAILSLESGSFLVRATTVLAWGLGLQSLILGLWLGLRDRAALVGSLKVWRSSLTAGFLGAFASQFWFIGFALTAAANVRTLALVEVLMAQAVSRKLFAQTTSRREWAGLALIVGGVVLLLAAQT